MKHISMLFALTVANELGLLPEPYEKAVRFQFCGECPMLSVKEKEQKRGEKHYCKKYNKQVFHMGMHPKIVRVSECDEPTQTTQAESLSGQANASRETLAPRPPL